METLYGESPEIQIDDGYGTNGGIALYSAGDGSSETITGGSGNDGSSTTSSRYYWSITRTGIEPTYTYSGGITGESFFFGENSSPFVNMDYQTIWNIVSAPPGNLDGIFDAWNERGEKVKHEFLGIVLYNCPEGCYSSYTGG